MSGPLYVGGVPVGPEIPVLGKVLYADADGLLRNSDVDQTKVYSTLQGAIDAANTGRGDVIYVMPGAYDENVVISGKSYLSIIGVQSGYGRPDVAPSAGIALSVTASQGLVLRRMRFASADTDVVRNDSNGFVFEDCVFDGDSGQAATECLLRLWCHASDDAYTASEGLVQSCLFRGSNGYGVAFDVQHASVGVGPTHCVFRECRFLDNAAEDVIALETAAGTYSIQDCLFERCHFMSKNKATQVDIQTNNGASNTGNVWADCFFFDDTVNTTAIKAAGTGSGFIGCFSLDGVIDGDALD